MKIDIDNAAEEILRQGMKIIDTVVAELSVDPDLPRYLIMKDLWNRLISILELSADDLREIADEMEEDEDDDDDDEDEDDEDEDDEDEDDVVVPPTSSGV